MHQMVRDMAYAAASYVDSDGTLHIDRQGIRDHLNGVNGYSGLIGMINCDDFGDCGAARITVVQNIGGEDSIENVMFSYAPRMEGVLAAKMAFSTGTRS